MNFKLISLAALGLSSFLSVSAFAETLNGKFVYKSSEDKIEVKQGSIELDPEKLTKIKMVMQNHPDLFASKIRVAKVTTENRTIVLAAFRNVKDLPEGTTLIMKANLLSGTNGKVLYGDVFTRTCETGYAAPASDEASALERILLGLRERKGCDLTYRGGILLSTVQGEEPSGF